MMRDWNDGGGFAWWWMLPMLVFMVAVAVAVIVVLVRATGPATRGEPPNARTPTPEDVLAHRLAAGEIDTAEYKARVETLQRTKR